MDRLAKDIDKNIKEIWSHPNRRLEEHLRSVYEGIKFCGVEDEIAFVLGYFHDAIKSTQKFQLYLRGESKEKIEHAFPSALIALIYILQTKKNYSIEKQLSILLSIAWHHTGFKNLDNLLWNEKVQISTRYYNEVKKFYQKLKIPLPHMNKELLENFYYTYLSRNGINSPYSYMLSNSFDSFKVFFQTRYYLSSLVASDRIDAMTYNLQEHLNLLVPELNKKQVIGWINQINDFVKASEHNQINQWRTNILKDVLKTTSERWEQLKREKILTLSIPTGGGKTLTSFRTALELIKRGLGKRIIYVLPFINIGNQTYNFFTRILNVPNKMIMLDNYLSIGNIDTSFEELDVAKMLEISRYWHAPIVITTSVHIWDILFGRKNSDIANYHLLKDAIVIWDEVQSIKYEFWEDMEQTIKFLSDNLNTFSIVMSATQPLQIQSLTISEEIPEFVNRYKVQYVSEQIVDDNTENNTILPKINNLMKLVQDLINQNKTVAIITNTVKQSKELFRTLKENLHVPVLLLNTKFIPKHREKILSQVVNNIDKNLPFVLVSTQVIEAGVDLDFDVVIRYLAPIDSLIQSAGRTNRNGKRNGLFIIYDNPNKGFNDKIARVYGIIKSDILVREFLDELKENAKDEYTLNQLSSKYFNILRERGIMSIIMKDINNQIFVNKQWNLIDYRKMISVIINWHDEAEQIRKKLLLLQEKRGDKYEKMYLKKKCLNQSYSYMINIFYNMEKDSLTNYEQFIDNTDLYYIYDWREVYDEEEGWIGNEESSAFII